MGKPWLTSLLLDKLARQIGAATRASQKKLEKAAGAKAFAAIFATADLLLVAIRKASQDLGQCEPHLGGHTASKPEDPLWKTILGLAQAAATKWSGP